MSSEADTGAIADADGEAEGNDPDAPNRLQPKIGSTTMKPIPPPQRVIPPKVVPEHTEVSLISDKFKKARDDSEDIKGSYLT